MSRARGSVGQTCVKMIKCSGCGKLCPTAAAFQLHCQSPDAEHDDDFSFMCEEVDVWADPAEAEEILAVSAALREAADAEKQRRAEGLAAYEASLDPAVEEWVDKIEDLIGFPPERPQPQPAQLCDWGLFLGGKDEAQDLRLLRDLGIGAAVNMAPSDCGPAETLYGPGVTVCSQDADDAGDYPLLDRHLPTVTRFLDDMKTRGIKVLVHCYAGMNRSATIITAYLVRSERMQLMDVVRLLKERRGVVLKNRSFTRMLVLLAQSEGLLS